MKFDTDNISGLLTVIYHFSLITNYFWNLLLVTEVHELNWKLEATHHRLFCITTTEAQAHLLHHRSLQCTLKTTNSSRRQKSTKMNKQAAKYLCASFWSDHWFINEMRCMSIHLRTAPPRDHPSFSGRRSRLQASLSPSQSLIFSESLVVIIRKVCVILTGKVICHYCIQAHYTSILYPKCSPFLKENREQRQDPKKVFLLFSMNIR